MTVFMVLGRHGVIWCTGTEVSNSCFQVLSERMKLYVPLKRWYPSARLHGITVEYVRKI